MCNALRINLVLIVGLGFCDSVFGQATWHVDDDTCPAVGSGTAVDPFCSIQAAIDASTNGDAIEVADGTYVELINFDGKAVTLRSLSDDPEAAIIDGNNAGTVVTCNSGETPSTVLRGLTITRGHADFGGGMNLSVANPTVINCVFRANGANGSGGAVYCQNTVLPAGPSSAFIDCVFIDNFAWSSGAGMDNNYGCSPTLTNCKFIGNFAPGGAGAGLHNHNRCSPILTNCIFSGNDAGIFGGGVYNNFLCHPVLTNCTFNGNTAIASRGAIGSVRESEPVLTNCIVWNNGTFPIHNSDANTTVSNCILEGGLPSEAIDGGGNIDANPVFVDPDGADGMVGTADDNLRLSFDSPAIDAGSNGAVPFGIATDLGGFMRFFDDQTAPDTGIGTAPIVDMGAYEFGLADCNGNDVQSLFELNRLVSCMTAPGGQLGDGCSCVDLDVDGDVDLRDFRVFQWTFAQ